MNEHTEAEHQEALQRADDLIARLDNLAATLALVALIPRPVMN